MADRSNVFLRDGIQMLGRLGPDIVKTITSKIWRDEKRWSNSRALSLEDCDVDDLLACDELRQIAKHPMVMEIVGMHLQAKPKILDVSAWRSLAINEPPTGDQQWHRDVDDWRAAKLFVYLTDVDEGKGPHCFVPGSHRFDFFQVRGMAPERYFWDGGRGPGVAEVVEGLPRIEILGPAGTMFLANTYCFHKGKPPIDGSRIIFQVCYGLMDIASMTPGSKIPRIRAAWGE